MNPTQKPALLSDERIEKLAVEHEAFGFGRIDAHGFTTHGFDPDGIGTFARAIESEVSAPLLARIEELEAGRALEREKLIDLIADRLSGTYHCLRVWNAWNVGTMSQDDFEDVGESDTPAELADEILAAMTPKVKP